MISEILQPAEGDSTAIIRYTQFPEAALVLTQCDRRLVFLHSPWGNIAEQYRRIANRIASHHPAGGTLMITSPAPEDGKTLSAMNLAFSFAERGPTLLVDFDTRHSSVRHRLGLPLVSPSVEDALTETTLPDECVLSVPGTRLCVAFNRGQACTMVDLMGSGRPKRFLDWAFQKFMWVIFDTPPAFPIADTLEIAQHASIGLLVLRARKTPVHLARQAMDALKGRIQFVMLNDGETPNYPAYYKSYFEEGSEIGRWE